MILGREKKALSLSANYDQEREATTYASDPILFFLREQEDLSIQKQSVLSDFYSHSLLSMRFLLYTLRLAGFIVGLSCMSGSTLEITDVSSVTAGPYPKLPDVVECASEYGENLDTHACYKALQTMPDGRRFSQFASSRSYPGQEALITPVYYYDNESRSLARPDLDSLAQ